MGCASCWSTHYERKPKYGRYRYKDTNTKDEDELEVKEDYVSEDDEGEKPEIHFGLILEYYTIYLFGFQYLMLH
jgi:hypothetical protein